LGQALQLDPRFLGIFLQKYLTLLDLSLFDIFYARKKLTRGVRLCFFSFSFPFQAFHCGPHSAVDGEKADVFSFFWLLINFFNLLFKYLFFSI
jgi:hypothetical protein